MTTIHIQSVNKVFRARDSEIVALRDINLDIASGEFICLLGPSGCGKSTLLNAIAGFSHPSSGRILADQQPISGPGPERGMVFQEYALFGRTCIKTISTACKCCSSKTTPWCARARARRSNWPACATACACAEEALAQLTPCYAGILLSDLTSSPP